jgi:hypothetical protein
LAGLNLNTEVSQPFSGRSAMRKGCSQLRPTAMDSASHGSDLDIQNLADFLIGQALDVAKDDCGPEFRRQS